MKVLSNDQGVGGSVRPLETVRIPIQWEDYEPGQMQRPDGFLSHVANQQTRRSEDMVHMASIVDILLYFECCVSSQNDYNAAYLGIQTMQHPPFRAFQDQPCLVIRMLKAHSTWSNIDAATALLVRNLTLSKRRSFCSVSWV